MKAAEVLRLYDTGRRDFRGEDLRDQNFKGRNLSCADFSRADIRNANFINANLTQANFTQAKAGPLRCWETGLIVLSFLLSACLGYFSVVVGSLATLGLTSKSIGTQFISLTALVILGAVPLLLIRKGIGAVAILFAFACAITLAFAFANAGAIAVFIAGVITVCITGAAVIALALAFAFAFAGTASLAGVGATTIISVGRASGLGAPLPEVVSLLAIVGVLTLGGAYIGRCALNGDERYAWIRSTAVAFAAIGSTSFRGATLTDADFSQACLNSTDLRRAVLLRTCWREADKLHRARLGETYLNTPKIRQLVLTGESQGQSYSDLLNLAGINLQGANLVQADFTGSSLKDSTLQGAVLTNARFIGTNLNGANLQDADLSHAQIDGADLTGATLTGACIKDWNITTRTRLRNVRCDYVFMRRPEAGDSDPNPHRKPDDWSRAFTEREFSDFIALMVSPLDS